MFSILGQKKMVRGCDARLYLILLAEFLQDDKFQNNKYDTINSTR